TLFLRTEAPLPVGSMVPMVLELHDGQAIDVQGEVMAIRLPQVATAELPAGMEVQLVDFTPDKRGRIAELLRRSRTAAPLAAPGPMEQMIRTLRRVLFLCADGAALSAADYYEILGLPPTASAGQLREACSILRGILDPGAPPEGITLGPDRNEKLDQVFQLVVKIEKTLTDPAQRAEYDAVRSRIVR